MAGTGMCLYEQLRRCEYLRSRIDFSDLLLRMSEMSRVGRRPGFSGPLFNQLFSYGKDMELIDPPSSDEGSDVERALPSLRTTVDSMLDTKMCDLPEEFDGVLYHRPALILLNISSRMTVRLFKNAMSSYAAKVEKMQVVDFPYQREFCRCGVLRFRTLDAAMLVFEQLRDEELSGRLTSRLNDSPNYLHPTRLRWLRNRMKDPKCTWIGVVIREIERRSTTEDILTFLQERRFRVIRIEPPRLICVGVCAIVVMGSMNEARDMILSLNKKVCLGAIWKLHLHPYSHTGTVPASAPGMPEGGSFGMSEIYDMMRPTSPNLSSILNNPPRPRRRPRR